ncbi:branched-chain amino acid transport system substrate-binding protein [Variovorax boronicumulans]|uniref:ABC transporter substrate-binding protein n=1 Tax=Variovorax boronicumulans TaxID=436515 RepID=UPI00277DE47C|nr:ABC transporter substrate-binding protein [Variovorax boronicumulans]MDP9995209.1 branched-chain amino acid transport system substrate-binding protein [Variovorax boronicumulans]MDQ0006499.1 branched-chain amino acid transport system substrate-binding protein [Variovorax boronicumulans]
MKLASLFKAGVAAALLAGLGAQAQEIRIGLLTTLTGPLAPLGQHVRDGFNLAVEEEGGKLGGFATKVIVEDDQLRPDVAVQLATKLAERDKIQILTGVIFSNVAMAALKPAVENKVFFISPNAGPSQLAGKQCSPWFYATAWQNDQPHEAMGAHLQAAGVKKVYLVAPNYNAGKEALRGFKTAYKGNVVGESYPGMNQLDFAAEISQIRAAKPDAIYVFLSGGMGVNFTKQYAQAKLVSEIPMYSAFTIDAITLPAIGDAAVGTFQSNLWNADLKLPANEKFVQTFQKKFGYLPSNYAAQSYDSARLIAAALKLSGGQLTDKKAFANALRTAKFDSLRGPFAFNTNNFPIGDFYLLETVKRADGKVEQVTRKTILSNARDNYAGECRMATL